MIPMYYLLRQDMQLEERAVSKFHGLAFVVVSDNKIEHVAGDEGITKMVGFVDGSLKVKKGAKQSYEILPLSMVEFDMKKDVYLRQMARDETERRVHNLR